jgi:mono/diheme cytochrome c family protein
MPTGAWRLALSRTVWGLASVCWVGSLWAQGHEVHGNTRTTLGQQVVLRADAPSVSPTHSARALYVLHCAGCHSLDGSGSVSARVPDMRQLGLFLRVPGGREFLIQVPGVMGSGLNDAQVAEVSNWVLNNLAPNSLPKAHTAYTVAEVSQARRTPLTDVAATRASLVQRAHALGVVLAQAP